MKKELAQKIKKINQIFHEIEAEIYDERHEEILWEKEKWQNFSRKYLKSFKSPVTVLDVGTGTGFVPSILAEFLTPKDKIIMTDVSAKMLKLAEDKLSEFDCQFIFKEVDGEKIDFLANDSVNLITVNSVLHHLPKYQDFLKEADRVLRPGGIICIMHEPNKKFAQNKLLVFFSRLLGFLTNKLSRKNGKTKEDLTEKINNLLEKEKILKTGEKLDAREIQSLVDVWSPTAGGKINSQKGFNPYLINKEYFSNYQKLFIKTYNHLGKINPQNNLFFKALNALFMIIWPKSGSSFSLALRKKT